MRNSFRLTLGVLALCASHAAHAEEPALLGNLADASPVVVRGFGTVGVARSSTDQAEFVRDISQSGGLSKKWASKVDNVFGLQANFRVNETLEAITQIVTTYHEQSSYAPKVHWAFLRYTPTANTTVRVGRVGLELFMNGDSRYVGYSQLTIRPSVDYYGSIPLHYFDGADIELKTLVGEGVLKAKVFGGYAREKFALGQDLWSIDGSTLMGGYLDYQDSAWQWRAGYMQMKFSENLPISTLTNALNAAGASAAANRIAFKDTISRYYSLGAIYDGDKVVAQFMLNRIDHESDAFENVRGALALIGYRINAFTPYAGYSRSKSDYKPSNTGLPDVGALVTLNNNYRAVMRDSHTNQHTVTLGVRWDVKRNMALKAQFDMVRGAPDSILMTRSDRPGYNGRMNILGIGLDFVF